MAERRFAQDRLQFRDVRAQRHGELDLDAARGVGIGPVDDRALQEHAVRHDDVRALEGLDFSGADVDAAHEAFVAIDHHPVAGLDRPLHQQDHAGDHVVGDVLQAEADADG